MGKKILAAVSIILPLIFCSCNFAIPKSVTVKTDADLSLDLGTINLDISKVVDKDTIFQQMSGSLGEGVGVYEYYDVADTAGEDPLTYMVHYPVASTDLNMESVLNGLNLDSMLGGMSGGSGLSMDNKISIPAISINNQISNALQIDLAEMLMTETSDFFKTAENLTVYESSFFDMSSLLTASAFDNVHYQSIATVTYATGSAIEIKVTKNDSNAVNPNFKIKARAYICTDSTDAASRAASTIANSGEVEIQNGNTISLQIGKDVPTLADVDEDTDSDGIIDKFGGVPSDFYLVFEAAVESDDTTMDTTHNYSFDMTFSSATKIEKIKNIQQTSAQIRADYPDFGKFAIDDVTIDLSDSYGTFKQATVKEGYFEFTSSDIPALQDADLDITYDISMTGLGLNIDEDDFTDNHKGLGLFVDKYLDLAGKTLVMPDSAADAKITVSCSVNYEVLGKSIDITGLDTIAMDFNYEAAISKLYNVVVDFTSPSLSDIKTGYSMPTAGEGAVALPESVISYVSGISFGQDDGTGTFYKSDADGNITSVASNGFGIVCDIKNTLPVSIPVTIKSELFNYEVKDTITGSDTDAKEYKWISYPVVDLSTFKNDIAHYVDLSFEFDNSEMTIGTVSDPMELGKEYEISMTYKSMSMDWDSVTLRSGGISIPVNQPFEAFTLDSVLGGFSIPDLTNVELSKMDVFFYLQKPETGTTTSFGKLLDKIGFSGKVSLVYKKSGETEDTVRYLHGSESVSAILNFKDAINWPEKDKVTYPDEYIKIKSTDAFAANINDSDKYNFHCDLASIIKDQPEGLNFCSDLGLTSKDGTDLIVYKKMLDDLTSSDSTSIGIDMLAVIPFSLDLKGDISMDVMSMYDPEWDTTNADKDLLNREAASSYEQYAEYANAIKKMGVYYTVSNDVFKDFALAGSFNDAASSVNKEISLDTNGVNQLVLSGEEIKNVLTTYPFHPAVAISLKGGTPTEPKTLVIKRSIMDENAEKSVKAGVRVRIDVDKEQGITIPFSTGGEE